MTRHYKAVLFAVVASLFLVALGPVRAALAQAPLDAPTVTVARNTPHHVWLSVTAGPSGAPNGVYIEWMNMADYNLYGGWAPYGDPTLYYCSFTGKPTLHTSGGLTTFAMAPNQTLQVVLGDLFDETGISDNWSLELDPQEQIIFHGYARGNGTTSSNSANSADLTDTSDREHAACVFTQGYWKNHPGVWPVTSLTLGTVTYTQAQLLQILNTPAGGNALLIIAHQLIATKLNIANGADPTLISSAVSSADALIGSLVIPPIGSGFIAPSSSTETLNDQLTNWNETEDGSISCGNVTPTINSSWGHIKTLYR